MPPELYAAVANWGFPALLVFYGIWRFDQTILPKLLSHLESVGEMVEAIKGTNSDTAATKVAAVNAEAAAKVAADGVQELLTRVQKPEKEVA